MNLLHSLVLATSIASSAALSVQPQTTTSRRDVLSSLVVVSSGILLSSAPAALAEDPAEVFLGGTYTDPNNHPGGTRTIELAGTGFAGYQLATVKGGGGQGEPESYELPAMIFRCPGNQQRGGKWCITIDFTPKGGPKDFQGYWDDEKKGIRFVLDNNFWPKN